MKFNPNHPRSSDQVQRLVTDPSQLMTVRFQGQLSFFQTEEEVDDVAEILLGFFIPWERLPSLFHMHNELKRRAIIDGSYCCFHPAFPTPSKTLLSIFYP
jgi:hypothetical protein